VMGHFATGVTVITSRRTSGELHGLTANAFTSVSLVPPLALICVDKKAESYPCFEESKVFTVNVLTSTQEALSRKFAVSGGNMPVYFARPANVQNPPVILICMEVFGLHEWVKDVTRRVGHLGALAVAPNYYFRSETGGVDLTKFTVDELPKLFPIVNAKTDTELFADLDATVAWAKSQGGDTSRLGIIGFCRGGRNVWHYSTHNPGLKAGIAFYGSLVDKNDAAPKSSIDLAAEVKEPVLGLYGEADTGITPDQVKQMEAALKAAGKTAEFHEYPGAPHGFVADYRPSYRKDAAEDAWAKMTAWLKKYGVLS